MNKRIRKKQLKRALRELVAISKEREAERERVFRKAMQGVLDAYGKSNAEFAAAFQCYLEIAYRLMASGPLPSFLEKYQPPRS